MKKSILFPLWGVLAIICAMLGFIPEPAGAVKMAVNLCSLLFFIPPALLLWLARQNRDVKLKKTIRNLSIASLLLTVLAFTACVRTAMGSEALGNFLHGVLNVVSVPMLISPWWALSLFLWSCLLVVSIKSKG